MTVAEAIAMLKKADPQDEVQIWDPDSDDWQSLGGMIYGGGDGYVQLHVEDD
jgi:hypothetical protein